MAQVNGAANVSSASEAPRGTALHFPWRPFSARFRVMIQFRDYGVALVYMAGSRKEAVRRARLCAEQCESEAKADQARADSETVASVYTEVWVEDAQGGRWEVLRRIDGGFYRGFHPRQRRIRERRREDEALAQ